MYIFWLWCKLPEFVWINMIKSWLSLLICSCKCLPGYRALNGSRWLCDDIDECSESAELCEAGCVNLPGTYRCQCAVGTVWDQNEMRCIGTSADSYHDHTHNTVILSYPAASVFRIVRSLCTFTSGSVALSNFKMIYTLNWMINLAVSKLFEIL